MNRYKKLSLLFSGILVIVFLTGCKNESMKSPEKLLDKPITDQVNYQLYKDIRNLTPGDDDFILPKNADDVGRINLVDLNNNSNEEVIVFKKKENENPNLNSIYTYIFETKGNKLVEETLNTIRTSGDCIKYANFVDLNNDGKKEIILQIRNRGFENIYIYKYIGNKIKKVGEYTSSKYTVKLNLFDYDGDGKKEILALIQDLSSYEVSVNEMLLKENKIVFNENFRTKNIDNLDKIDILNGRVSKNINGSIIIYQSFNGSSNIQILTYKDGKFQKTLDDQNDKVKNPFTLRPSDVDGNGVLEIPKMEFKYSNNTPNESKVISWYEWDGLLGSDSTLNLTNQIFYSYDYNFKIVIPQSLNYRFFIRQEFENNKNTFEVFARENDSRLVKLYDIVVLLKNNEEYKKSNNNASNSNVLYENEDYKYIVANIDLKSVKKYNLNIKDVNKSFYQINK